jgi:hypothetical protein
VLADVLHYAFFLSRYFPCHVISMTEKATRSWATMLTAAAVALLQSSMMTSEPKDYCKLLELLKGLMSSKCANDYFHRVHTNQWLLLSTACGLCTANTSLHRQQSLRFIVVVELI